MHLTIERVLLADTKSNWEDELGRWLKPAQGAACVRFISRELIGPGDRKSVQPMAARLAPGEYDQLHHFIADGLWGAAPLEAELLVQADRLVGGKDAVLVIDDTATPKKGDRSVAVAPQYASSLGKTANCQNIGVADACAGRSAGHGGITSLRSRELDEQSGAFEACGRSGRAPRSADQARDRLGGD